MIKEFLDKHLFKPVNLMNILHKAISIPEYQPGFGKGYKNATCCNLLARDVLDNQFTGQWVRKDVYIKNFITEFDYNISSMNPGKNIATIILNTTPNNALKNVLKAGLAVKQLEPKEAQEKANEGIPVWVAGLNHEAIVYPNKWNLKKGPMIAQAGGINGIFYVSDWQAWGKDWKKIKFFLFPERR